MRSLITIAVALVALFLVGLDLAGNQDARADYAVAGCSGAAAASCSGVTLVRWTPLQNIRARRTARMDARHAARGSCGGSVASASCSAPQANCSAPQAAYRVAPVARIITAPVRVLRCVGGQCAF